MPPRMHGLALRCVNLSLSIDRYLEIAYLQIKRHGNLNSELVGSQVL